MSARLVGGIGLTLLRIYDQRPGPDGVTAGCAHVHALTGEAYFGLSGEGALELHDVDRGFRRVTIRPGTYVQFPPGTLHRSVSTNRCEVLAVMGNAGLAERGDARIYFGADVDADPQRYEALRSLVDRGLDGALERRDASARAYQQLMDLWEKDHAAYFAELRRFLGKHHETIVANRASMEDAIRAGPLREAQDALELLTALDSRSPDAVAGAWREPETEPVLGMCGMLWQVARLDSHA
ncbi:MAG: cupin domain-containing protein [Betaproteobacteria bacterium]|jgi:mannose-6-phosphate isomerase-like protein (cupin superfamily)|nr:cupin domain-containing protein [Betaproteobacteria bacterium]